MDKEELESRVAEERGDCTGIIIEFAESSDGQKFMRKQDNSIFYKADKDREQIRYVCARCNSQVLGAVTPSKEVVPFCPQCEEAPPSVGSPSVLSGTEHKSPRGAVKFIYLI